MAEQLLLVMLAVAVASAPVLLYRAHRRREPHRVFEMLVCLASLAVMTANAHVPGLIPGLGWPGRVASLLLLALFVGSQFGLSRWLFSRSVEKIENDAH